MEMSVSSEMTFFTTKQQSEICPHLRTGSSAEDRGRIDTRSRIVSINFSLYFWFPKTVTRIEVQYNKPQSIFPKERERERTFTTLTTPTETKKHLTTRTATTRTYRTPCTSTAIRFGIRTYRTTRTTN